MYQKIDESMTHGDKGGFSNFVFFSVYFYYYLLLLFCWSSVYEITRISDQPQLP